MSSRSSSVVTALLGSFLVGALLGACGPTRSLCATVTCEGGRTCDEATGACVGGATDGGATDGGSDGGTDGGGGVCVPDCVAPQVCNPGTGQCVECFSNADCACPTTVCGASGLCELPAADAGLPPGGEACASAPIVNTCGQTIAFTADLATASDEVVSSCGTASGGGKDLLWTFRLDAAFDVRVTAKPSAASQAQPVVSLRRDCQTDQELACADGLGGTATFLLKSLAAGSYTLVLDSYDAASSGRVDVTVEFLPASLPPNETCATAAVLAPDTDVTVDLTTASDDLQLSCNTAANSGDAVYELTLTEASDVFISATATGAVDPVLALRRSPCASGGEVTCFDVGSGPAETLVARNLAAGTYYVIVERYGATGGTVTVRATLTAPSPPPPNDTCAAPRAITFPSGATSTTFTVDTSLATDSTAGSCNTEPNSPEVVYSLTLTASRLVTVSAIANGSSATDAVVYLRGTACDETGTELACDDALPPGPDGFSLPLTAGTYFLFVEGFGPGGAGPTDVTVTLGP